MRGEIEASSHLQLSENLAFYLTHEGQSHMYVNLNDWGDDGYNLFQATEKINVGNTQFIIGVDKLELEKKFGDPIYSMASPNGIMSYYKHANLLIEYNDGIAQKFIITFKG